MVKGEPGRWRDSGSEGRTPKLCDVRTLAYAAKSIVTYLDLFDKVLFVADAIFSASLLSSPKDGAVDSGAARIEVHS